MWLDIMESRVRRWAAPWAIIEPKNKARNKRKQMHSKTRPHLLGAKLLRHQPYELNWQSQHSAFIVERCALCPLDVRWLIDLPFDVRD